MKIRKVTLTGPDDTTQIEGLVDLSKRFPFVEWGILCSRNSEGGPRFPSLDWRDRLTRKQVILGLDRGGEKMNLSGHLCGSFVNEILDGEMAFANEIGMLWNHFQRVQINTHGRRHTFASNTMAETLNQIRGKEFIFQFDGKNREILDSALKNKINASTLFDLSHGAGVLPGNWPLPLEGVRCGYAGGLSPENLEGQLALISTIVPEKTSIWIDAETHVRSNHDREFDLKKVEAFLEICAGSGLIQE